MVSAGGWFVSDGLIHVSGASTEMARIAGMSGLLSPSSLSASNVLISKQLQPGLLMRQQDSKSENRI